MIGANGSLGTKVNYCTVRFLGNNKVIDLELFHNVLLEGLYVLVVNVLETVLINSVDW